MDLLSIYTYNLNSTMECSQEKINFLDLQIHADSDGTLHSSLYRKPSAGNTILQASSAHPQPFLDSIPYSQFLRLRRNCTLDADFHLAVNDLSLRLHQRGYSRSLLNKAFNKVAKLNRKDLIHSKRPSKSNQSVRIITRFSKQHTQMRALLDKFWPLLTADNMINKYIKPFPEITYRWAPSMKDRLVTSHSMPRNLDKSISVGTFPCGRCDVCSFISNSRDVVLPNGVVLPHGRIHTVKYRVTCKTVGVLYLATCQC